MLICKHTIETNATPEAIWGLWEDVENWNTWDSQVEFSTLDGPFEVGTTGSLKPKRGPLAHIQLTQVEPMKKFVSVSKLPLTRLIFTHIINSKDGKTSVTHQIEMNGPLGFLFALLLGQKMKKNLPNEMQSMISKVEKKYEKN